MVKYMENSPFVLKSRYKMDDLLDIMRLLRSPQGCLWDREQDHASIRINFLEEAYEVLDAIDEQNPEHLCEELGDTLLQVVFHTQMEDEKGVFCFDDVTDAICKKLIVRHPHVFGSEQAETAGQVLNNWDEIKRQTKGHQTFGQAMDSVPKILPALMRAEKLQRKAAKAGFDWPDVSGAFAKIEEELEELKQTEQEQQSRREEELGDLLFSVVNAARFLEVEPEQALERANEKFLTRFKLVEQLACDRGLNMKEMSLEQLDQLWDEIKG